MADPREAIVQRMIDAGESEENIATVIQHLGQPQAATQDVGPQQPQSLAKRIAMTTGDKSVDPDNPIPTFGEVMHNMPGALGEAALGELGGAVVGKGLRLVGRGLYRAGALPLTQMFAKYGDLVGKGLEEAVPVTKGGAAKAANLKMAAQATKQGAVSAADATAGFRTQGIVDDALGRVQGNADELRRAGLGDPSKSFQMRGNRIVAENGPGVKPSELESIKGTIDDTLGPAYKKLRAKEVLSPNERMSMALSHAAGDAQSTVVPNYRAMNKDIMDSEGLRRMIVRRLQGNQGLENALTMAVGPAAIPARIAMLPGVASSAAIAAHHAAPAMSQATRAALLALLGSQNEPNQ